MTHTAKHTPGPWIVRNMSDAMAEKFTVERLSDNGLRSVICRINDMEVCPEHGGTGSDANAHLIAAAPAMYEAGTLSLDVMERVAVALERMGNEGLRSIVRSAIIEQKAALAQAEARS